MPTQVLLIDDHPIFLEGVTVILKDIVPDCEFFLANNGVEGIEHIDQHPGLDWIYIDVNLPDINGIELLRVITERKVLTPVILFSADINLDIIDQAFKNHASGFLSKTFTRGIFEECMSEIEAGNTYLAPELKSDLKSYREGVLLERQNIENELSKRQQETLLYVAKGYSNAEIASSLGITESTVKSHVSASISAFSADNRTHCVAEARRLGFIPN